MLNSTVQLGGQIRNSLSFLTKVQGRDEGICWWSGVNFTRLDSGSR